MMSSVGGRRALPFIGRLCGVQARAGRPLGEPAAGDDAVRHQGDHHRPGAINTPIWDKTEGIDIAAYKNSPYLSALERARAAMQAISGKGLPPERVGELVHRVLTIPSPRVRYAIVPNRLEYLIRRMLPRRVLDRIIAGRLGLAAERRASAACEPRSRPTSSGRPNSIDCRLCRVSHAQSGFPHQSTSIVPSSGAERVDAVPRRWRAWARRSRIAS